MKSKRCERCPDEHTSKCDKCKYSKKGADPDAKPQNQCHGTE